ncbi:MAG: cytochrome-c oxidase, cbb3-type subunit III [Rhodospirillaceae bacterium]|nr:cytochrome-c oxidase, cbb3-type subunit III [Rhodospirillaceae bacterium]MBT4219950.1 cytochrome-c oxidase, cbb3-type subunit III [Rhodospirillaceae bacterium]MBT4463108.1 cytochrome-c oxidase, cbb3-type subunit III [Rhodospirillaceae bacterium]MBT5308156.1 cytochrome-c oxidase, cbb3-type subunit III [Rhodospirillaceae bacterium]MBT6407158.1 cytochrome-c oxidase, cbb3-type subunit III [Rhodospirillaceae bacterium]
MAEPEKDALSGRETTGHEWDGLKELNTPLPRWWLWVLYATIVWAVAYTVVYPAWPTLSGYTKGMIDYSSRGELAKNLAAVKQSRSSWINRFEESSVSEIAADNDLLTYAMAGGRAVFAENCAPCHAAAGSGSVGYPSLADDDWLWGGKVDDIYTSIRYGIRSDHDDARVSDMPAFGADELLNAQQVADVTAHVMSLSGGSAANAAGATVFEDECAACHGEDGTGNRELGAPNLADAIWLNGSGVDAVNAQVKNPKHGVMPAWVDRLDDVSVKQVSVYVHSLGGGQ